MCASTSSTRRRWSSTSTRSRRTCARASPASRAYRCRPHLKTAKSPDVARLLVAAGAGGICVAKLSEAEVMHRRWRRRRADHDRARRSDQGATPRGAAAGAPARACPRRRRLVRGRGRPRLRRCRADRGPHRGERRCRTAAESTQGRRSRSPIVSRRSTALRVVGVQGYEGNLQHVRDPGERRTLLRRRDGPKLRVAVSAMRDGGHAVDVVSTGGTGTAEFCAHTASSPRCSRLVRLHGLRLRRDARRCRLPVRAHADRHRAQPPCCRGARCVDAGLKTLSNDSGDALVTDAPGWKLRARRRRARICSRPTRTAPSARSPRG